MAENFDLDRYIMNSKLKDASKDTLLATFKAYGTQEVVKTLDKNFKGEKDEQKKVALTLGTLLTLYGIFKSKMNSGNERGESNKNTDYSNFGGLKHCIYAGFSQITYLDWFKARQESEGKPLIQLLGIDTYFSEIRSGSYKTYYLPNKDYKYLIKKMVKS